MCVGNILASSFSPSFLILENGFSFSGLSPLWQDRDTIGEAVFTTAFVGYPETLTDPSFAGQIIVFTYPLLGNYGVPKQEDLEGETIFASGVVFLENALSHSHSEAAASLLGWLQEKNIPAIFGIDTRKVAKTLRHEGSLCAVITKDKHRTKEINNYDQTELVKQVSIKEEILYQGGEKTVILVDLGMKRSILRKLLQEGLTVRCVPYDYDYTEDQYDGVILSNGPGNPMLLKKTINILQKAMLKKTPIFGICLGHQLLALAAGAKTYKLPFGHRGINQPCINQKTKKCFMTSQNHGFAIDESTIPENWQPTFINLNDGSIEGIEHKTDPFFSVQFHPEAAPGPEETAYLFKEFAACL